MEIILASASPRRRELLGQIGLKFRVCCSNAEEIVTKSKPEDIVMELSEKKAEETAGRIVSETVLDSAGMEISSQDLLVIGADTLVFLDGEGLGKPSDASGAFAMLSRLQGRSHQVYTGVTLLTIEKGKVRERRAFYEMTQVEFYPMSEEEIREYIGTGEPMGKAGAYGIQGIGGKYVKRIEGDYNNVVGLPTGRLYQEIKGIRAEKTQSV